MYKGHVPVNLRSFTAMKALALVVIVSTLALIPITQVSGNGPHMGGVLVFQGLVGPYQIRVEAVPLVGNFHMTVFVSHSGSPAPVTEATVQVEGKGPENNPQKVGPVSGTHDFLTAPNAYALSLPLERAGRWVFTVTVNGADGAATVDVPVVVQQPGEANWLAPTLVVLLFVLLWQVAARLWERRDRPLAPL